MSRFRALFLLELLIALLVKALPLVHLPFDWFQTFFHELSHGLAALLTGGEILAIRIAADTSGSCLTSGGIPLVILFAGYAGGALWGYLIYLSVTAKHAKKIALSLALLVVVVGVLWVRDWVTPWILLTITALFMTAYRYGNRTWVHRFVAFVGLYVLIEAFRSPFYLIDGQTKGDGSALAQLTYLPELVWILLWILIAGGLIVRLFIHSAATPGVQG